MSRYHVNLEVGSDGSCMARVIELPGCFAIGPNREQTLDRVRSAIASHVDFLKRHGEQIEGGAAEIEVAQEANVEMTIDTASEMASVACFASDGDAPSDEEIERALRWLTYSRRDLLGLFEGLPPGALDRPAAGGEWTLRTILHHVASSEAWYLSRLEEESPGNPSATLEAVRNWAIVRLRQLTGLERRRVNVHRGEKWTARKVLRRFLEHEQEHLAQLKELAELYRQS
jgi:predicted RNase H-like HicB family nuclease/uncharacterized damage-inducible protein DinB